MIDTRIILNFLNFDSPCPGEIKNCKELRDLYKIQKDKIVSKQCTTCTVADFTDHFIKNILYKNVFNINKVSSKEIIKLYKNNYNNIDFSKENFLPKKLFYSGKPLEESTYFSKKFLYIVDKKRSYKVFAKILCKLCINNYCLYILGKTTNSLKKYKLLLINEKNNSVIYASKDSKDDEI